MTALRLLTLVAVITTSVIAARAAAPTTAPSADSAVDAKLLQAVGNLVGRKRQRRSGQLQIDGVAGVVTQRLENGQATGTLHAGILPRPRPVKSL